MPRRKRARVHDRARRRSKRAAIEAESDVSPELDQGTTSLISLRPRVAVAGVDDSDQPTTSTAIDQNEIEIDRVSDSEAESDVSLELNQGTTSLIYLRPRVAVADCNGDRGRPVDDIDQAEQGCAYLNAGTVFDDLCEHCDAFKFKTERAGFCCENGKVRLSPIPELPREMEELYARKDYKDNLRSYNNAFAMSSLGCNEAPEAGFSPTFKLYGKIYHRIGALLPPEAANPKFLQMYFYDLDNEIQHRMGRETQLDPNVLRLLKSQLSQVNSYVKSLSSAEDIARQHDNYKIVIVAQKNASRSSPYALPVSSEVAVIVTGNETDKLDVVIQRKGGDVRRIHHLNQAYDPTHYVLLLPFGTPGFTPATKCVDGSKVSVCDFYKFVLQLRQGSDNHMLRSLRLSQQYACDMWVKVESCKLTWVKNHQAQLRAEKYKGLMDALDADDNLLIGRRIILPATHYGSPRWYAESFQNAMAIVRQCGKPDLFITFTCNPKWPEILNSLQGDERPADRPDLIVRVFHLKWQQFKDFVIRKNGLGKVAAYVAVKEDQKRGLPHIHLLLTFTAEYRVRNAERLKQLISAEIPHTGSLRLKVIKHMIHGPCSIIDPNQPCMRSGKCDKKFPIPFVEEDTAMTTDGVAVLQRRSPQNGGSFFTTTRRNEEFVVDNRYVVSYSPILLDMFDAHINVLKVNSVLSVKYALKYTFKGSDKATFKLHDSTEQNCQGQGYDEIEHYATGRYVGTTSALWRLYKFDLMENWPPVQNLTIHLPDEQTVVFQQNRAQQMVENGPPRTMLTAFFELAAIDDFAKKLTYVELPKHYIWNGKDRCWQARKRRMLGAKGTAHSAKVGRLPTINLNVKQRELYFARMLLHHVRGPTSFNALRTVNDTEYETFCDTCKALGLLSDDRELISAVEEAANHRFGSAVREMFAYLLMYSFPTDPKSFWDKTKEILCEDIKRQQNSENWTDAIFNTGLHEINEILNQNNMDLHVNFNFPEIIHQNDNISRSIKDQLNFDINVLNDIHATNLALLTSEQKSVYSTVLESVETSQGLCFSLNAAGGTGKTFVVETILAAVRREKSIAIATATSGIAALLLTKGQTLHSRCKVPLVTDEDSVCNISPRDSTAELFRLAKLLIIDEVTMGHRFVFEAIDRSLRDIRMTNQLFGGLTVLLSGDWRQTLHVVKHGIRGDIVQATLKNSYLWEQIKVLNLTRNMRAREGLNSDANPFAEYLLAVGEDRIEHETQIGQDYIKIPNDLTIENNTLNGLLHFVFANSAGALDLNTAHHGRCIITPLNVTVDEVNEICMNEYPGRMEQRFSADCVEDKDQAGEYPTEILNCTDVPGFPKHTLSLKSGCPVMLLRNLNPTEGHCNGSRYAATNIGKYVIEAVATTGHSIGKTILIPRIVFSSAPNELPFTLHRKQFPLRSCFALTVNKAQGQSLEKVGIYLPCQVFSHGQLYVAMSRAKKRQDLKIVAERNTDGNMYVRNIVYREVL